MSGGCVSETTVTMFDMKSQQFHQEALKQIQFAVRFTSCAIGNSTRITPRNFRDRRQDAQDEAEYELYMKEVADVEHPVRCRQA